jgi:hypothetical protein
VNGSDEKKSFRQQRSSDSLRVTALSAYETFGRKFIDHVKDLSVVRLLAMIYGSYDEVHFHLPS